MELTSAGIIFAAEKSGLTQTVAHAILKLHLQEDCTVPFIARYRKERTDGADEVQIRDSIAGYEEYVEREKRRHSIIDSIEKLGQLTPALKADLLNAQTLAQLEDIYAPYKSKKKTKAMVARERGLEALAQLLLTSPLSLLQLEEKQSALFVPGKLGDLKTFQEALQGACDIIVEQMSHHQDVKELLRACYWREGVMVAHKKDKAEEVKDFHKFQDFFQYQETLKALMDPRAGHRFLAMRRGMTQGILKVEVQLDSTYPLELLQKTFFPSSQLGAKELLEKCAKRAYSTSLHPSLDLEIKGELKKLADGKAIEVFGENLKNLLLAPYLGAKRVMGIDPGIRTGCKVVVLEESGQLLTETIIYPHPPRMDLEGSQKVIQLLLEKLSIGFVAIGNGTYGRETLEFLQTHIPAIASGSVSATLISESGASLYSTSEIARQEFPDKDPTIRSAISIARRFQDPLAELVKIEPKNIGVGQYQHDVNASQMKKTLSGVVESCVNFVGVNLNTASAPLLAYISGLSPLLATHIVKTREQQGAFSSRQQLLKVPHFGPKAYEQSAGFLRIYSGENPLDGTFVHPERYSLLDNWCQKKKISMQDLVSPGSQAQEQLAADREISQEVGTMTFADILASLKAPSQDPRTAFKSVEYQKDLRNMEDLKINQWVNGVVTNITAFGAFVDIGIKENGLLHISEMANHFVQNALEHLKVGQEIKVKVLSIDRERKRISLSCREENSPQAQNISSSKHSPAAKIKKAEAPAKNPFAALKNLKL